MTFDRTPLWVSLSLAGMVSIISVCTMTPLAWYAVKRPGPLTRILDILLVVPMSLPPTVLGFYFLLLLSPSSPLGRIFEWFGISLLFSFPGLVLACSVAYSPYLYRTLRDSFVKIEPDLWNASLLLGKGPVETFFRIILPLAQRGMVTGLLITFLHCLKDFGLVFMVGGSIPGLTRTVSIALYEEVEMMHYEQAHQYALLLIIISILGTYGLTLIQRERES